MRKIISLIILIIIICTSSSAASSLKLYEETYFSKNRDLGSDVNILKSYKSFTETETITSFDIDCDSSGSYSVSFWLCPLEISGSEYESYEVRIDGKEVGTITPKIGDWQSIGLDDYKTVYLKEGTSEISIVSNNKIFPLAEHVQFSKGSRYKKIDDNLYVKYRASIRNKTVSKKSEAIVDSLANVGNEKTKALNYNERYKLDVPYYYTFYCSFIGEPGIIYDISTRSSDSTGHVIEIFNASHPEDESWSILADCYQSNFQIQLKETGFYYLRVRAYGNYEKGLCDISMSGVGSFIDVPIFSTGIRCFMEAGVNYNSFTCHNRGNGDPVLWLESGYYTPGRIVCVEDDYIGTGDFNWKENARIHRPFECDTNAILLSSYSSYFPEGICDLYAGYETYEFCDYFGKSLKPDDTLTSGDSDPDYNCFAWSVGITDTWEHPNEYLSDGYSSDPLEACDKFYLQYGFTREGANEENAAIALWNDTFSESNNQFSHASVRKWDATPHGYDWDSKLGFYHRIFHEKNGLTNEYGEIKHYYRPLYNNTNDQKKFKTSLHINDVLVASSKLMQYNHMVRFYNHHINELETLFKDWNDEISKSIHTAPAKLTNSPAFDELLKCCSKYPDYIFALTPYILDHNVAAIILLPRLAMNSGPWKLAFEDYLNLKQEKSPRSMESNTLAFNSLNFLKYLAELTPEQVVLNRLKDNLDCSFENEGSNNIEILSASSGRINVVCKTEKCNISLRIVGVYDLLEYYVADNITLYRGDKTINCPALKPGQYIIIIRNDNKECIHKIKIL